MSDALAARFIDERRDDWREQALAARRKRFGAGAPEDFEEKARQSRFLAQRGFEQEHIRYALDE